MLVPQALLSLFPPTLVPLLLVLAPPGGVGGAGAVPPGDRATAPGATNILDCVNGLRDQDGGPCLRASSTPIAGMLLPYPGQENSFSGTAVVSGGRENTALGGYSTVGGGHYNTAQGAYSTVGGGYYNTASSQASVGGGWNNDAAGSFATVGGGQSNTASALNSTVAGGFLNEARGGESIVGGGFFNMSLGPISTVSGGASNTADYTASTVAGGYDNLASAAYATVSGGSANNASGTHSAIVGGSFNEASGDHATSAGRSAKAVHDGSFVWGDSTPSGDKASSLADEFSVFADGGVRLFAEGDATTTPSLVVGPDGEVGVGTASPIRPLHVVKGASGITPNVNAAVVAEGADDTWLNLLSDTGQVGVLFGGSGSPQDGALVYDPGGVMIFRTGGNVNRMRITAAGNVGIGTTAPAELLDVAGDVRCVSLIQTSDARFKRDVRGLAGALETVLALRGVSYEWDRERFPAGDDGRHLGFLAQEVRKVVPEAVQEAEDGTLSVDYSALVPVLVEAVQDLEGRVSRLQGLETTVARLERELDATRTDMAQFADEFPR